MVTTWRGSPLGSFYLFMATCDHDRIVNRFTLHSPVLGLGQLLGRRVRHALARGHASNVPALSLEPEGTSSSPTSAPAAAPPDTNTGTQAPLDVLRFGHGLSQLRLQFSYLLLQIHATQSGARKCENEEKLMERVARGSAAGAGHG